MGFNLALKGLSVFYHRSALYFDTSATYKPEWTGTCIHTEGDNTNAEYI
jgi:hypothetical protein